MLGGIARALRPGGRLALTAFNAYFAVRYHPEATFDADAASPTSGPRSRTRTAGHEVDLWTGCYTPRELRLL